jgi:hypothetical protein
MLAHVPSRMCKNHPNHNVRRSLAVPPGGGAGAASVSAVGGPRFHGDSTTETWMFPRER